MTRMLSILLASATVFAGAATLAPAPAAAHPGYHDARYGPGHARQHRRDAQRRYTYAQQRRWHDQRRYRDDRRRCDDGDGGTVIGAVAGGLAGNEIAGRGDKALGTVLGAVVGGLAGRSIDRADDPCRRYR